MKLHKLTQKKCEAAQICVVLEWNFNKNWFYGIGSTQNIQKFYFLFFRLPKICFLTMIIIEHSEPWNRKNTKHSMVIKSEASQKVCSFTLCSLQMCSFTFVKGILLKFLNLCFCKHLTCQTLSLIFLEYVTQNHKSIILKVKIFLFFPSFHSLPFNVFNFWENLG